MSKNIRAIAIVEIAGRPAEYIKEAIRNHISQLKKYKGIQVISDTYSEPKKIESSSDMFTCFSEIEFEVDSFLRLADFIFDFMPASIEIINPSIIEFNVSDATALLNTLAGRLHKYDEMAGIAQMQVQQLAGRMKEMQEKRNPDAGIRINTNVGASEIKEEKKKKKI
jgi:hypothetical protein